MDNYYIDDFGIIHQRNYKRFTYDEDYLDYYEGLKERTIRLGYLRMGYLMGKLHGVSDILEIGYGSGSFLSAAKECGFNCYGNDINRFPLPEGCEFVEWDNIFEREWGCVALYDVLEHIPDLSFLSRLNTQYIVISVPFCRYEELGEAGEEWFMNWRMRLPDEHLHHFNKSSLTKLLTNSLDYVLLDLNHMEDGMRLREGEEGPNVLTALFRRQI
jgi:hypothetical protein